MKLFQMPNTLFDLVIEISLALVQILHLAVQLGQKLLGRLRFYSLLLRLTQPSN